MKEFNKSMLEKLYDANEALRGKADYFKYHMQVDCKNEKSGKWFFVGHSIPLTTGTFKKVCGKLYIMMEGGTRYEVTQEVKELLAID